MEAACLVANDIGQVTVIVRKMSLLHGLVYTYTRTMNHRNVLTKAFHSSFLVS